MYLVFVLISDTEFLKPLNFLSVESNKGVFCYVNESTFGTHLSRLQVACGANHRWLEGWNFQSRPQISGERGERDWRLSSITNGQWFSQSCLSNKASIKPQKNRILRASGLRNKNVSTHVQWCQTPNSTRIEAPLFKTSPYVSLPLALDSCPLRYLVIRSSE